jgi:hypothetical protein
MKYTTTNPAISRALSDINSVRQRNGAGPLQFRFETEDGGGRGFRFIVKDVDSGYGCLLATPSGRWASLVVPETRDCRFKTLKAAKAAIHTLMW